MAAVTQVRILVPAYLFFFFWLCLFSFFCFCCFCFSLDCSQPLYNLPKRTKKGAKHAGVWVGEGFASEAVRIERL